MSEQLASASAAEIAKQLLWPPASPVGSEIDTGLHGVYWIVLSVSLVVPFAAILHNTVFDKHSCMLGALGKDYTPSVVSTWLRRDPSLPWAIAAAMAVYLCGTHYPSTRLFAASIFVSFLPLSVWIWDIPFTKRAICEYFHDDKFMILDAFPLKSRHFYALGVILYASFTIALYLKAASAAGAAGALPG
jgi:hypothetical protein